MHRWSVPLAFLFRGFSVVRIEQSRGVARCLLVREIDRHLGIGPFPGILPLGHRHWIDEVRAASALHRSLSNRCAAITAIMSFSRSGSSTRIFRWWRSRCIHRQHRLAAERALIEARREAGWGEPRARIFGAGDDALGMPRSVRPCQMKLIV
jgi:hypothetical protein